MRLNAKYFKITASIDIFDYTLDLMEVFPVNIISYTLINFLLF